MPYLKYGFRNQQTRVIYVYNISQPKQATSATITEIISSIEGLFNKFQIRNIQHEASEKKYTPGHGNTVLHECNAGTD